MTYKKKLIEVALPLATINAESGREKSIRFGHPSTLHLWWARRPLAAARAVLWASLVDDPSARPEDFPSPSDQEAERKRLFGILERFVRWEASSDPRVLAEARAEVIRSCDGELPRILDPFSGGGAIPLEAVRLGLPAIAGDLNPVAVLIQRAMLEVVRGFAGQAPVNPQARAAAGIWEGSQGIAADVRAYGDWLREQAKSQIGRYYPDAQLADGRSATPIAWIWARTVESPDPAWPGHVPLVKTWVLAKRPGKPDIWVEPEIDQQARSITYRIREGGSPPKGNMDRGSGVCIATGAPIPDSYIKSEGVAGRMGRALMAVVAEGQGGRIYLPAESSPEPPIDIAPGWVPTGAMSDHPQYMGTPRYGLDEWSKLFTTRQMLALTTFSDGLLQVREQLLRDAAAAGIPDDGLPLRDGGTGPTARADAVVTYLAFAIDKAANLWSSLASWMNDRGAFREVFARQAVPMTWDFAEANPFSGRGGDFGMFVDKIVKAVSELPTSADAQTAQRDARARIAESGKTVLSTDPPYYDNVPYADLSDFFYVWLRHNLSKVWPDELATILTPKADELVANHQRAGSKAAAKKHFEVGMGQVFAAAAAHADTRFPATIFYAFKATESKDGDVSSTGWETFLSGLLDAGYSITSTWPMRTESPGRIRATGSNALASSIVLACRPREVSAPLATRREFISALRSELEPAVRLLQMENIAPVDLAQSAMGPGIAIYSRYAKVVEADGSTMSVRSALALINDALAEILSGEESEFDADTRFAITWFEQYGHNPGPFGDADLLARAKDTTVAGVAQAGVVASRDGKVRLVERAELPDGWDPSSDTRLTVWETTQHLIRELNSSEADAARLLARLGQGLGDSARQLAYLLYLACDRKKWSDEASSYNMLVTAWPEISRLAASGDAASEGSLF